jgi:N-acetyl-gamma-glutamyl-phosphate reductase
MNQIGIIGDTGMVGSEILRILEHHDKVKVSYKKNSKREEGNVKDCKIVFLATNDEQSLEEAPKLLDLEKKVIDLSGAFRITKDRFEKWYGMEHLCPGLIDEAVYGLPAWNREEVKEAKLVANPGCYPISVLLAIKPISDYLSDPLRINATSGSSGTRKEAEDAPNEQTYSYGRKHRHLPEMEQYSGMIINNFSPIILHSVFRGINANIEAQLSEKCLLHSDEENEKMLRDKIAKAYIPEDLVQVAVDTKDKIWGTGDVVETHKAVIKLNVEDNTLYLTSMIDNLGKGAASQAVENMNIMLDLPRLYGIGQTYKTTS